MDGFLAFEKYMGWAFGDPGCETFRARVRQGHLSAKIARKGRNVVCRYYSPEMEAYAVVGVDSKGAWAAKKDGAPISLSLDLLQEFVATMQLFTNALPRCPVGTYSGHPHEFGDVQEATIDLEDSAHLDVFLQPGDGELLGAIFRTPGRAVSLAPRAHIILEGRRRFYNCWARSDEPLLFLDQVELGGKVYDAEVQRLKVSA